MPVAHMRKEEVQPCGDEGSGSLSRAADPRVERPRVAAGARQTLSRHLPLDSAVLLGEGGDVHLNQIIKNGLKYLNSGILIEIRKNPLVHQERIG